MPRVYLSETDRLCARLASWIYGQLKIKRISQRELASEMNISQSALNQKLKSQRFMFEDFLVVKRVLQPDEQDLMWLLGEK